ncbi:MAG: ferrous iron transport protein A [Actinobacteria bacterium]|nr:ferrous iron transport protein A [Actinomycetota bacterium]
MMSADIKMPLGFMNSGESGVIEEIRGMRHPAMECEVEHPHRISRWGQLRMHPQHANRGKKLENRLVCMGIVPGESIQIVKNSAPGPVIVAIKDTRLCLDRALACKIMVSRT